MSSLPNTDTSNDKKVTNFFDNYYNQKLEFNANEVDAVINFFEKRGFEKSSAISTGTVLLQQAKLDDVKVFKLLDTLKGLDEAQLSVVVAEVLNYNRLKTSTLGVKTSAKTNALDNRNVVA